MTNNSLSTARAVERPTREAMLRRAPTVQQFWFQNRDLFADAWKEWEAGENDGLNPLDSSLYDPKLRSAVEAAWEDPTKESGVKDLWKEAFPGVKPPYGISLNRGGAMLDRRSEGYLAAPNFQALLDSADHCE